MIVSCYCYFSLTVVVISQIYMKNKHCMHVQVKMMINVHETLVKMLYYMIIVMSYVYLFIILPDRYSPCISYCCLEY